MCRYGMVAYKPHFACFDCRKTFKRRLMIDIDRADAYDNNFLEKPSKCPDCGQLMADMGLDFEAPKKSNIKAWNHLSLLFEVGITFHSCGCGGPGYVPRGQGELLRHFEKIKLKYIKHRRFWSSQKAVTKKQSHGEKQLDWNQNGRYYWKIPKALEYGTKRNKKIDIRQAINYWSEKIAEIDKHLAIIRKN